MANPRIVVDFLADASRLTAGLRNAQGGLSAFRVGAVAAGTAAVAFLASATHAAIEDAEAQEQLATTLRNTTGATDDQVASAEAYISSLSRQVAIADDDLRPALNTLVRGFGDVSDAQDALALATDISAGTGRDLASVSEALSRAAMGNTSALRRLGVATTDAQGNALTLDQMMAQLSDTFSGQAANAADTAAGRMRNAQIQMDEAKETIGTALLPVVAELAGVFVNDLAPILNTVANLFARYGNILLPLAGIIGGIVAAVKLWNIATVAWAAAQTAATAVVGAARTAWMLLDLAFAASPIGVIVVGVVALAAALVLAYEKVGWFHDAVDAMGHAAAAAFGWLLDAAMAAFDWIKDHWQLLLVILTGPFGLAVSAIVRYRDEIIAAIMWVVDFVRDHWQLMLAILTGPIGLAVLAIVRYRDDILAAFGAAVDWLRTTWATVEALVTAPFTAAGSAIETIIGNMRTALDGAVSAMGAVGHALANAIKSPINAFIRAWNAIRLSIPGIDAGPIHIGGQTLSLGHIAELAQGGVVSVPTLALVGEGRGREIVTPEDLLRSIVAEHSGGYTMNLYPRRADPSDVAWGFRRLELARLGR